MRKASRSALLALVLHGAVTAGPGVATAQLYTSQQVGVYFDATAQATWQTLPAGSLGTAYVILTPVGATGSGVRSYEFRLGIPAQVAVEGVVLPPGAANIAQFPEFQVVTTTPLPSSSAIVLATVTYRCLNDQPAAWELGPLVDWGSEPATRMAVGWIWGANWITYYMDARQPAGVTNPDRAVVIDVEPEGCEGRWRLEGPDGWSQAASGDTILPEVPFGEYTITWEAAGIWAPPALATWTRVHSQWNGPCLFEGTFVERARILIEPKPLGIAAPWFLAGPGATWMQGTGAADLAGVVPGNWSLLWVPLPGWGVPFPDTAVGTVATGGTLTFVGAYQAPAGVVAEGVGSTLLHPARPNPFNPRTTLRFELSTPARVSLQVFDLSGRLVRTLVAADLPAGSHETAWDGTDAAGGVVASGGYLARLTTGREMRTVRLQLVR